MDIIEYCQSEEFDQKIMDIEIERRNKYERRKEKLKKLRKWYKRNAFLHELYLKNLKENGR